MLTRHVIIRRAGEDGVDAAVAERDYVLAHIGAQLNRVRMEDGGRTILKGGTALRLVHIGAYRYSADLDFTIVGGTAAAAVAAMARVLDAVKEHAGLPHLELLGGNPPGVAYIGPLGAARPRTVKLDFATDEYVETVTTGTVLDVWPDLPALFPRRLPVDRDRRREAALHHPAGAMPRPVRHLPPDRRHRLVTARDPRAVRT